MDIASSGHLSLTADVSHGISSRSLAEKLVITGKIPRKPRWTDRRDMTKAVEIGVKPQTNKKSFSYMWSTNNVSPVCFRAIKGTVVF